MEFMLSNWEYILCGGSFLLGGIFVFMHSLSEFNSPEYPYHKAVDSRFDMGVDFQRLATPSCPKLISARARYLQFALIFSMFALFIYLLFTFFVVRSFEYFSGGSLKSLTIYTLSAFISMIALLGLLELEKFSFKVKNIPVGEMFKIPKVLLYEWLRNQLHQYAHIPMLARGIYDELQYNEIDLESAHAKHYIKNLLEKRHGKKDREKFSICARDFTSELEEDQLVKDWIKLSYCINVLDEWSTKSDYETVIRNRELNWLELKRSYENQVDHLILYRKNQLDENLKGKLRNHVTKLLADTYRLMTSVVILASRSTEDPLVHVNKFGYQLGTGGPIFAREGEVIKAFLAISLIIVSIMVGNYFASPHTDFLAIMTQSLSYIFSAFFMFVVPVALVIATKKQLALKGAWPVFTSKNKPKTFFQRPVWLYILLSILAWVLSTTSMVFIHNSSLSLMMVFCFISAIIAFATACKVDTPPVVYKTRLKFFMGISFVPLLQGLAVSATVILGLRYSGVTENAILFVLMAFFCALALGYALFFGKHIYERRATAKIRERAHIDVEVYKKSLHLQATLVDQSPDGARLSVKNTSSVFEQGSYVEIKTSDGQNKTGKVVAAESPDMHIFYEPESRGPLFVSSIS